jgi:hypothetical protein
MIVSINGIVASLAITEFIASSPSSSLHHRVHRFITGLRPVEWHLTYYGHLPQIRRSGDRPADDCYYCHGLWRRAAHTLCK